MSPTADARDVTAAYRRFALRHHPDRGGDPERFAAGVEAYHRLLSRPAAARADVVFHRRSRPGLSRLLRRARSQLAARSRS